MKNILKRNEFITEIYIPEKVDKEYNELVSINEGILKNLFGKIKNLFKNDWETINGNQEIISAYKEFDDKLSGFSFVKLTNRSKCNKIRQELVTFAELWYDHAKDIAKKNESDIKPFDSSMDFKNNSLKDSLEKCKKNISILADDPALEKWSDILMNNMSIALNQVASNEIKDKNIKEKIKEDRKNAIEKQKKINIEIEKIQNELLDEVSKRRNELMAKNEAYPIYQNLTGDKAIENLCGEFDKIKNADKENLINLLKKESILGLKKYSDDFEGNEGLYKVCIDIMDQIYNGLNENEVKKDFENTPSQSVQAMFIALNSFIKHSIFETKPSKDELELMTRCAIVSNGLISYNLPLNEEGDKNKFSEILEMIYDNKIQGDNINYPDNFKRNATKILNDIVTNAKALKNKEEKEYNDKIEKIKKEVN